MPCFPAIYNIVDAFVPLIDELVFTHIVLKFTSDNINTATKCLLVDMVVGSLGMSNEVLKRTVIFRSYIGVQPMSKCCCCFPFKLKRENLVFLHKGPGKPFKVRSSYLKIENVSNRHTMKILGKAPPSGWP